jgi:hypothetical protein
MTIKRIRSSNYVQITEFECAIQAHWNSFESIEEATKYLENEMVLNKGTEYGFCVSKNTLWKYTP